MSGISFFERNVKSHTTYTGRTQRVHPGVAAAILALGVAACAAPVAQEVEIGFRNPTAPFGGTSRFDEARFSGEWQTVACLGTCADQVRYVIATDDVFVRQAGDNATPYTISAPGVLRQMGADETLVVMWVDEGFHTAAVGDADGRWAAILDRSRKPGRDRVKAAREILDFNGWDVSQLVEVKR